MSRRDDKARTFVSRAEAERAQGQGETGGAIWTPPPGALPRVLVHLTSLAPALEGRDLSDDKRWRWLSWVTPAVVIRQVLLRLQRSADQVALRVIDGLPGLEVHDGNETPPPGCARLLAIIFDAPAQALIAAHAALIQPQRSPA